MTYIDGFVAAVLSANREIYKKHAEAAAVVFKEHGALKVVECWGDDVPDGKVTSFPMAVKCKDDETVAFSWIIWPSRQVRDQGMKKVMADPRTDTSSRWPSGRMMPRTRLNIASAPPSSLKQTIWRFALRLLATNRWDGTSNSALLHIGLWTDLSPFFLHKALAPSGRNCERLAKG